MDSKGPAGNMSQEGTTVDGRNPAPADMVNTPLFTGFYTSQWCRISSINRMVTIGPSFLFRLHVKAMIPCKAACFLKGVGFWVYPTVWRKR